MDEPLISIVMSVYNAEQFLAPAIESILSQTYTNFEFIIIDDGSTDDSWKTIKSFSDKRIDACHQKNKGLPTSLNLGVSRASGKYIARMDQDDISMPKRFEKQIAFLESHPQIGIAGTNYHVIDNEGRVADTTDVFTHPDDLKLAEIFTNQFGHGTVLARAELLQKHPYDPDYENAEDYDLWTKLARVTKLANLKEPLYQWRLNKAGMTVNKSAAMHAQVQRIQDREFAYFLNHRRDFKVFSFRPFSTRGGVVAYLNKKARLYRDMALLYCYTGWRRKAVPILLLAWLHAPWSAKTYRQLFITIFQKDKIAKIDYEVI